MESTTGQNTRRGGRSRVAAAAGALLVLPLASGCGDDVDEGETLTVPAEETVEVDGWDVSAEFGDDPVIRAERGDRSRTWHGMSEGTQVVIGPTVYRVQDVTGGEQRGRITLVATDAEPPQ